MIENIKIPIAMQLRVDDVGWHNGADERFKGQPSRSGIPRHHHINDYKILHEIGKGLNMKISCSLVLGEWDKDNILRGEPHMTFNEDGWDRKSEIDYDYAEKAFEILETSEYLDYTMHGVLHGYYHKSKQITEAEFYPPKYDAEKDEYIKGTNGCMPDDEFRRHFELFYKIYNSWGFKKRIKAFASPCGCRGSLEENEGYANVMKEYGIYCWQNGWGALGDKRAGVTGGVICMRAPFDITEWDAYDVDPDYVKIDTGKNPAHICADFCSHWTNYIRWYPEKDLEYLPKWIAYFERQAETFGAMLSRDVEFAASQALYSQFAKVDTCDNKYVIDLSEVDGKGAVAKKNEFYVSLKNGTVPKECIGGKISEYEAKKEFKTYKIERENSDKIEIILQN